MNNQSVAAEACAALGASQQQFEAYPTREVQLGSLPVLRALPVKGRRLIGPWCFLDRFGPLTFALGTPMENITPLPRSPETHAFVSAGWSGGTMFLFQTTIPESPTRIVPIVAFPTPGISMVSALALRPSVL